MVLHQSELAVKERIATLEKRLKSGYLRGLTSERVIFN